MPVLFQLFTNQTDAALEMSKGRRLWPLSTTLLLVSALLLFLPPIERYPQKKQRYGRMVLIP